MKKSFLLIILLSLCFVSCGKKGNLYLPEELTKEEIANEAK
jgi:predicted small lipoprotein YifL